jgi:starvation-inducible outer membrane lipoprotein
MIAMAVKVIANSQQNKNINKTNSTSTRTSLQIHLCRATATCQRQRHGGKMSKVLLVAETAKREKGNGCHLVV